MKRAQLVTAAAVLIACGCSESSVGPGYSVGGSSPPPEPVTITGIVATDSSVSPLEVTLLLESGEMVDVVGAEAQRLAPLAGAEIQVRGDWIAGPVYPPFDTDLPLEGIRPAFEVAEFVVLSVGGRAALDGVLGQDEGKYYLRLTAGDVIWFPDAPSEFDTCIGRRIWVTGSMEDPPFTFGVIG